MTGEDVGVGEDASMTQDLRYTVISEHGQIVLVCKRRHVRLRQCALVIVIGTNKISYEDLRSLIKEDLTALVDSLVAESIKGVNNGFDEPGT